MPKSVSVGPLGSATGRCNRPMQQADATGRCSMPMQQTDATVPGIWHVGRSRRQCRYDWRIERQSPPTRSDDTTDRNHEWSVSPGQPHHFGHIRPDERNQASIRIEEKNSLDEKGFQWVGTVQQREGGREAGIHTRMRWCRHRIGDMTR